MNEIVGGVLARAVARHEVDVHSFFVASNHVHLIVTAKGDSLPRFMGYFLGNVARKVGYLVDWTGSFWGRRYSAEPILDDEALLGRVRYVLAHGVKEGLVPRASEWPGISSLHELLGGAKRVFRWFNWTRRWNVRRKERPEDDRFSDGCAETIILELKPLPLWRDLSSQARARKAQELVAAVESEVHIHRGGTGFLGAEAVRGQHPHDRPFRSKRSPRPLCHSTGVEARKLYEQTYREFTRAFKEASARWRDGDRSARFPSGAFRPGFASSSDPNTPKEAQAAA